MVPLSCGGASDAPSACSGVRRRNFTNVAKTIKSHWSGVINYAETKISNGVLEGINSMVQSAKSSARGFRTTKNIILIIYLRLGKLQFNLPT